METRRQRRLEGEKVTKELEKVTGHDEPMVVADEEVAVDPGERVTGLEVITPPVDLSQMERPQGEGQHQGEMMTLLNNLTLTTTTVTTVMASMAPTKTTTITTSSPISSPLPIIPRAPQQSTQMTLTSCGEEKSGIMNKIIHILDAMENVVKVMNDMDTDAGDLIPRHRRLRNEARRQFGKILHRHGQELQGLLERWK